jgi:outer membrane protein OmpA-like peptidoglycan-associated protein
MKKNMDDFLLSGNRGYKRTVRNSRVRTFRFTASLPAAVLVFILLSAPVSSEEFDLSIRYVPGEKYKITKRADLRKYENGTFSGLSFRETRGVYEVGPASYEVSGTLYVFEETKHDNRNVAKRIEETVPVYFTVHETGMQVEPEELLSGSRLSVQQGAESVRTPHLRGYPELLNFPVYPAEPVEPGDIWDAYGVRVVDPMRDGMFTRVRFYCRYRLDGVIEKDGREYASVSAQYALRYRQGDDPEGDPRLREISGTRKAAITFDLEAGRPVFINERAEEQYSYDDGSRISYKGFELTFFNDIVRLDSEQVTRKVEDDLVHSGVEDVEVEAGGEGVTLRINNIHFVPDRAEVLPDERPRLEKLAAALKKIEDRTFKVIGHTADIGTAASQFKLSEERAKVIIDFLTASGMAPRRFIYEGRGGTDPVAPNDTEENRARNRRVEIIILED